MSAARMTYGSRGGEAAGTGRRAGILTNSTQIDFHGLNDTRGTGARP